MSTPTLLFVDNDPHILAALRQVFRREPCTVLTARNAKEALDLLAQQPIAILITDQRMPGMTGLQLLRQARQLYPGVFRILMSGQVDEEEFRRATDDEDVQRIICKPWDVDEFQKALRGILETKGASHDQA